MIWTVNTVVGYLIMVWVSYQFSRYLYQLHENDMWFSEIMVWSLVNIFSWVQFSIFLCRRWSERFPSGRSKGFITLISNSWFRLPASRRDFSNLNRIILLNQLIRSTCLKG